jgi:hypothetical protein
MQDFEHYVKSNYHISNAAACNINYTFSKRAKVDRKSKANVIIYTITMKLTWLDADGKQLQTEKLAFANDELTKASEKQCHTINPGDTTNKFRAAKNEIIHNLVQAKQSKIDDLMQERAQLLTYLGRSDAVIPNEMKGTIHMTAYIERAGERAGEAPTTNSYSSGPLKTNFDM